MPRKSKATKHAPARKMASKPARVTIRKLPTGVPGLDEILGGGLPEFSFNLVAGKPGSGKTTMVHQIAFANATLDKPSLYFTVLGEPVAKMLRFQQQFAFFDAVDVEDGCNALQFSRYAISFLTDDIIRLRYVEIDGQLRKVLVVIKVRGGNHSKDIREYVITNKGVVMIHPRRTDYEGLISGIPRQTGPRRAQEREDPPEPKAAW